MGTSAMCAHASVWTIGQAGYFENSSSQVMVFDDVYPEGHQGGITLVQKGVRVAACGDVRLEATPGQWQGLPKFLSKEVDREHNTIRMHMAYPDSSRHATGFNPMFYPDYRFSYTIQVSGEDGGLDIQVTIDNPVPSYLAGKVGFNLELQPSALLGQPWLMDDRSGFFPHQAMGPTEVRHSNSSHLMPHNVQHLFGDSATYNPLAADDLISAPLAEGACFVLNPHDEGSRVTMRSLQGTLRLYDGRMNHHNGWFVLRSEFDAGASGLVAHWKIMPDADPSWLYTPVVQTSQVGYHPQQEKVAVIELDSRDTSRHDVQLWRITPSGRTLVRSQKAAEWGRFQRYDYLQFDFSDVCDEGLYQVTYGGESGNVFRIAHDVWSNGIWQSEIEYFLPVQMCHMSVRDKYRLWHGRCHDDDAVMAPVSLQHFDGYTQGDSTYCDYRPGDRVEGLAVGGWHDAGDWDLRIESQAVQSYLLALMVENLGASWDETSIDFHRHEVEIHQPDGENDYMQQIVNGALTITAGWRSLGRLYRGILCPTIRQYVFLGDAAGHTDRIPGTADDRWVFTEQNPWRELQVAAQVACVGRVLRGYNDSLSVQLIDIARTLYDANSQSPAALHAAVELYLTTGEDCYRDAVLSRQDFICQNMGRVAWFVGRFERKAGNKKFSKAFRNALPAVRQEYEAYLRQTPYGVPHNRGNRGSGSWEPQHLGFSYSMLHDSYPELFDLGFMSRCAQFFMGMHPGANRSSFVAGVGHETVKAIYGGNRADWSYIPGAVVPGTNLIRPDLPELLRFPFLWQQGEFCIDGHNTWFHYMVMDLDRSLRQ